MNEAFLSQIKTDGGTQMRADLSRDTISTYAEHLRDGDKFPPVVVFYDGKDYWLADGFHRFHAHKEAGKKMIEVEVHSGQRVDAVRYALKANATNGRPRTGDDMRRAYAAAVSNELCEAADTAAVQELLGCSSRWARELTKQARESAKVERNTRITELASEGKTQREIAAEAGVSVSTVNEAVRKRNSSETEQAARGQIDAAELSAVAAITEQPEQQEPPQSRGVGVRYAHEAIAVLKRIPLSDGLRQDAFDMVTDWIETNRG